MEGDSKFHLEIGSIEDFIAFIAVIRDKEIDIVKVREQLELLRKESAELKTAVENNS